jgi:hypothetical protein
MRLSDRAGIEGLPLRLMVVALLIALTLPIALGTLLNFQEQAQVRAGMNMAEEIGSAASSIYVSGEGNVRLVELNWPEGQQGSSLKLRLAGPVGSAISSRLDVMVNGLVSGQVYLTDPLVQLVCIGSERLEIGPDCESLRLSLAIEADKAWVHVEVA